MSILQRDNDFTFYWKRVYCWVGEMMFGAVKFIILLYIIMQHNTNKTQTIIADDIVIEIEPTPEESNEYYYDYEYEYEDEGDDDDDYYYYYDCKATEKNYCNSNKNSVGCD